MITPTGKKIKNIKNEYLSPQQYKLLRDCIPRKDEIYKLYFDIMYFLGLRPMEVSYIALNDINFKDKVLHYVTAKTYIRDRKPIPDPLLTDLKNYVDRNVHRFRDGFIFIGYEGRPILTGTASKKFRYYCKLAGLTSFYAIDTNVHLKNAGRKLYVYRLYSLRHSWFTNTLGITGDIVKTSKLGNHTKVDTTFHHYIDLDLEREKIQVINSISNDVFGKNPIYTLKEYS